jgi:hypothetical protein
MHPKPPGAAVNRRSGTGAAVREQAALRRPRYRRHRRGRRGRGLSAAVPSRRYQAESPDEEALVYAAAQVTAVRRPVGGVTPRRSSAQRTGARPRLSASGRHCGTPARRRSGEATVQITRSG